MPTKYNYTGSNDDTAVSKINFNERGIGFFYPFGSNNKAYDVTRTTIDKVTSNIRLLLQTEKGERVNFPEFGVSLRKYMFEQQVNDAKQMIEGQLKNDIYKWIPEVNIDELTINFDNNTVQIFMLFSLKEDADINQKMSVIIK